MDFHNLQNNETVPKNSRLKKNCMKIFLNPAVIFHPHYLNIVIDLNVHPGISKFLVSL